MKENKGQRSLWKPSITPHIWAIIALVCLKERKILQVSFSLPPKKKKVKSEGYRMRQGSSSPVPAWSQRSRCIVGAHLGVLLASKSFCVPPTACWAHVLTQSLSGAPLPASVLPSDKYESCFKTCTQPVWEKMVWALCPANLATLAMISVPA